MVIETGITKPDGADRALVPAALVAEAPKT
jgi:hypothetical protein